MKASNFRANAHFRRACADDRAFYEVLYADTEVMRYVGRVLSPAEAFRAHQAGVQLNAQAAPGTGEFILLVDDRPAGLMRLAKSRHDRLLEVGLLLATRVHGCGMGCWALQYAASSAVQHGHEGVSMQFRCDNPAMCAIVRRLAAWGPEAGARFVFEPVDPP